MRDSVCGGRARTMPCVGADAKRAAMISNDGCFLHPRHYTLLTVEGMEETNGWPVAKARELHALANPPVICLAEVGSSRAAPEFLLRRQESDDIAFLVNKIGRDAETVLRPAAMLADRRSVVRVALYPV